MQNNKKFYFTLSLFILNHDSNRLHLKHFNERLFYMIQRIKSKFLQIKPYIPTICFLCGSTWDTFTLQRIDNPLDMTIFSSYLLLSGILIILMGRWTTFKYAHFFPNAAQFFFGGLLSASTVLYFKSSSSLPSFFFILGLAMLLVGNEFLEKKYGRIQIAFFFWSVCAFTILNMLIPVLLHSMSSIVFLISILTALALGAAIKHAADRQKISLKPTIALYILLAILYFMNIIPPVPLSKKHIGIYHSVNKSAHSYICSFEKPKWYEFLKDGERTIRCNKTDMVYCFGSVYAPTHLRKQIFHHWYFKDPETGKYKEQSKIGYQLTGGRAQGYRGFTYKRSFKYGKWKVMVKTEEGKVISTIAFKIVPRDEEILLTSKVH